MSKLLEETRVLINALTDTENQPHQWSNDPDALLEVLVAWVENGVLKKIRGLCDNSPQLPAVENITASMALSCEWHLDEIMKALEQWRETVRAKCVL